MNVGLDEICEKHENFATNVAKLIFTTTTRKKNVIASHIIHLLLCCDDIQKCWNKEMKEYLDLNKR